MSTIREQQTAAVVRDLIRSTGRPPSVRDVAASLGLRSPTTAFQRLRQAVEAGLLREAGKPRSQKKAFVPDGLCPFCLREWPAA